MCTGNKWEFSFESETEAVFEIANNPDPLAGLKQDCDGVPMVLKLQEHTITLPVLTTAGTNQNIWFKTINK